MHSSANIFLIIEFCGWIFLSRNDCNRKLCLYSEKITVLALILLNIANSLSFFRMREFILADTWQRCKIIAELNWTERVMPQAGTLSLTNLTLVGWFLSYGHSACFLSSILRCKGISSNSNLFHVEYFINVLKLQYISK